MARADDGAFARLRDVCLAMPGATEQLQWGSDLVMKVGGKMFAVFSTTAGGPRGHVMSFKTSDDDFDRLTALVGVHPAPYLARAKWVALETFDVVALGRLEGLLREAYALVAAKLSTNARASLGATRARAHVDDALPSIGEMLRKPAKKKPATSTPAKRKSAKAKRRPAAR